MKKTIGIIVLVIIIVVINLVSKSNNQPSTQTSDQTNISVEVPIISNSTNQSTTTTASTTANQNILATVHTVTYTNSGFSPSVITIVKGQQAPCVPAACAEVDARYNANLTVTFVNNSTNAMWVASDPHPTHTDLPGFDELKSVGPGGSWSYTFTKVGTWGYHNHRDHIMTGKVIVQ